MTNIIQFYNNCMDCGNDKIILFDDANKKISKAGGIRAVCNKCGRNTKPQVWNDFNYGQEPDNVV